MIDLLLHSITLIVPMVLYLTDRQQHDASIPGNKVLKINSSFIINKQGISKGLIIENMCFVSTHFCQAHTILGVCRELTGSLALYVRIVLNEKETRFPWRPYREIRGFEWKHPTDSNSTGKSNYRC
ncbi:MAG: hypothetical protein KJ630_16695 [Proteobacteria bacterium]|nr:hypothetical protein [Pseudomonadota bacterium]